MEPNPLRKLIERYNPAKLKNYLKKHNDPRALVTREILELAREKFLESNSKNISNSYEIIKTLAPYNAEYVINLQDTNGFQAKYAEYVEHKASRDVTKFIDDAIDKKIIFPIKYPEKTSFIRKLLHLPPKRPPKEIYGDTKKNILQLLDHISGELRDSYPMITKTRINELIYNRLYNSCTKDLRVSGEELDKIFLDRNTGRMQELRRSVKKLDDVVESEGYTGESVAACNSLAKNVFDNLIPPHLVLWPKHSLCLDTENRNMLSQECKVSLDEFNKTVKSLMSKHISYLDSSRKVHSFNQELRYSTELIRNEIETLRYASKNNVIGQKMLDSINISDSLGVCKIRGEDLVVSLENAQSRYYNFLYNNVQKRISFPKNEMCEFEKVGVSLIEKISSSGLSLSGPEKEQLANFLSYATGNANFNRRLSSIMKRGEIFHEKTLDAMRKYSYKTANLAMIEGATSKMYDILEKDKKQGSGAIFSESEKLSLYEIGALQKFDNDDVGEMLLSIKKVGMILDPNSKLARVNAAYLKIAGDGGLLKSLSSRLGQDIEVRDGELVMDVAKKYHQLRHHKMDFNRKLTDFFTSYSHAAVGITGTNPSVSEIWSWYRKQELNPITNLVSERFKVHPQNLINPSVMKRLQESGMAGVLDELDKKYENVSRELNGPENFFSGAFVPRKLLNSANRRTEAGKADLIPFGHHGKENVRSWANKILNEKTGSNESAIIENILSKETNDQMICSEFAAKMTILSLVELERRLINDIREKDPNFVIPKDGLIKLPFNKDEDLSKVSPERLVKQLKKVNAIELVEKTGIAKNIIQR